MYIPPSLSRPVRLFSCEGHSWDFPSLEAFLEAYGFNWIRSSVGPAFRVRGETGLLDRTYPFVLRDFNDSVIDHDECYVAWRGMRAGQHRQRYLSWRFQWNGVGPVPGTGKRVRGRFRFPRTIGVFRAGDASLSSEGEPAMRGRRGRKYLPSAYDDRQVAARRDRSWKRYRVTRWKAAS